MKRYLFLLLLLVTGNLLSQDKLSGIIYSSEDSLPLSHAFVLLNERYSFFTDDEGRFVKENLPEDFIIEKWEIRHIGYQTLVLKNLSANQTEWCFYLSKEERIENTLSVTAGPSVVFGSEIWNVGDFAWNDKGDLVILTYEEEERWKRQEDAKRTLFKDGAVIKLDSRQLPLIELKQSELQFQRIPIPETVIGFYDQFPGELIIQGMHHHYLLYEDQDNWDLVLLPDSVMKKNIKPVVDTLHRNKFIISDFEPSYPAFDYFIQQDGAWRSFYHIRDEKEMELFRSEYKYLGPKEKVEAYQFELDHGVDKEIVAAYMRGFQHTHYHQELYSPLVVFGDTIYVFDHIHNEVSEYNQNGDLLGKRKLNYHLLKGEGKWMGKIWKDNQTGNIYSGYEKAGKVRLLQVYPSQERWEWRNQLEKSYVQKVRIRGGHIYYIYKPFESTKKRYLYKEKILYEID